jgi:hypothetical protein
MKYVTGVPIIQVSANISVQYSMEKRCGMKLLKEVYVCIIDKDDFYTLLVRY